MNALMASNSLVCRPRSSPISAMSFPRIFRDRSSSFSANDTSVKKSTEGTSALIAVDLPRPCSPTRIGTMSALHPGCITRPANAVHRYRLTART